MRLTDILGDPFGALEDNQAVKQRQDTQWEIGNQALHTALEQIDEDPATALATAVIGLLALKLAET